MRTRLSWIAREQDVVVLPTPPLPPTKIHRSVFWARMEDRLGSSASSEETVAIVAMIFLFSFSFFFFCWVFVLVGMVRWLVVGVVPDFLRLRSAAAIVPPPSEPAKGYGSKTTK